MKIFGFLYNPMIEESVPYTVSLHLSREGAEKALNEHKDEKYQKWLKDEERSKKYYESKGVKRTRERTFGEWEAWFIEEYKVLP